MCDNFPVRPTTAYLLLGAVFTLLHTSSSFTLAIPTLNTHPTNSQPRLLSHPGTTSDPSSQPNNKLATRREALKTSLTLTLPTAAAALVPSKASAEPAKDRTEGYPVQRSEREWAYLLSGPQYQILRNGGTERPNSSVLESEDRPGTFRCAGCDSPLFASAAKFHSGTGWPSFASGVEGGAVEVAKVNPVQMSLGGAEIRCATCGGHLGDVFSDGKLYVGSPAFKTGQRFCVDGAALVFAPESGGAIVYGDTPPAKKSGWLDSMMEAPKVQARDRI